MWRSTGGGRLRRAVRVRRCGGRQMESSLAVEVVVGSPEKWSAEFVIGENNRPPVMERKSDEPAPTPKGAKKKKKGAKEDDDADSPASNSSDDVVVIQKAFWRHS
ncbi:hypothetical protein L6452_09691 [Arctium lappa]|uniref:Uncharacterized protein n=1 Tax=Arctium lappa TaxID=4217 RepID=A0ACB9DL87_ARCLA|nr:hypothetical protein L6452_09691 [Arctium lappa]